MRLRKPCPHNRYEEHPCIDGRWVSQARMMNLKAEERPLLTLCPGGEFPTPAGFLVYGEYIPYDIFWKHTPFAAPTDQVVALYAEEGT